MKQITILTCLLLLSFAFAPQMLSGEKYAVALITISHRRNNSIVIKQTESHQRISCSLISVAEKVIDALPNIWSTIQNVVVQAGSVAVVAGTKLLTSTSENHTDYTIPQLPGELGDRYELYGRHFVYIKTGWKLASRVTIEDIWEMEDEISSQIIEPEYVIVEREGWTNNETYWLSTGMRLYKQCCTLGGNDWKTVLYYDQAYDATLTKDLERKRSEQKRKFEKVKALSSGSPNGRCWCGHTCFEVCNCDCACGCQDQNQKKDVKSFFEQLKLRADKKGKSQKFGIFYRDSQTKLWWSKDRTQHGGSMYKVFKETAKGLEWLFDADESGNMIQGKHKGPVGMFISLKEMVFYS